MKKLRMKRLMLLILIIVMLVCLIQLPIKAASFSSSAGKTTMTVGETTTFSLSVDDCLGKFTISSSDSSVVEISGNTSPWFEGSRKS